MKTFGMFTHLGGTAIPLMVVILMAAPAANAQALAIAVKTQGQVTFSKDVAPILQDKCQTCHRTGEMAPMSLVTYQEARPWAKDIKQRVLTRTMPPWMMDKTVGIQHFANDMSLSNQQIATIAKWVDAGAPQGDPKDMPAPRVFPDDGGWQLSRVLGREPDMVVEGKDDTIKRGDQDQWFRPITDLGVTEPRWVEAIEIRPSSKEARQLFHHITVSLIQDETNAPSAQVKVSVQRPGSPPSATSAARSEGQFMEWAINKNFDIFRDGTGKLIMPGAKLAWEYHTHADPARMTKDITTNAEMALYLYPKGTTPRYRVYHEGFQAYNKATLDIPPNSVIATQGFTVLPAPGRLENFQPHMHLTGKAMEMDAILPDGTAEVLSYVDHFNFNWMTNYIYADDAAPVLPKGTVIRMTAWLDNTAANPGANPNEWVGYGERSIDAMAFAHVNVTYLSDQDYQAWLAKHPKTIAGTERKAFP
jgi:cytochrome c553